MERVFDLSRSIDLHKISVADTREEAIAGITDGLIRENETVTWRARHLFKTREFTSRIVSMKVPSFFCDEMVKGDFKTFRHEHHFKEVENGTVMIDILEFESPYGIIGRAANLFFFKRYIEKFLKNRNDVIREYAETGKWKEVLN